MLIAHPPAPIGPAVAILDEKHFEPSKYQLEGSLPRTRDRVRGSFLCVDFGG
jgi:hypothetical protein